MRRLFALASVAAFPCAAFAGDLIVLADGRAVGTQQAPADPPTAADFTASNITVTEENVDAVVYRVAGVATRQMVPRAQVARVTHDPATVPPALTAGLAALAEGRFDEGRAKLVDAARSPSTPAWAQAEAAFRRAESYANEGNIATAERALATFAQDRPRSRFVMDALRLRARLLLDLGRDEDAKSVYDAASRTQGASEEEAAQARFLAAWAGARAALRANDPERLAAAAKSFDELRPHGASRPAISARCDVAKAACTGTADGLAPIVAASEDPFVLAVGNTLLGDAARRRGLDKGDRAALEEAQERYLKVALLYRDADGALDFAAQAQFRAGETFLDLAGTDPAAAADAKARARREWEDLVRRAPRTDWAKRAKAALASL
jgi:tetratricopeptide (TPR) repeat protein